AALELVEDRAVRLAHHLGEHVEAAAMRHADRDVFDAERAAALDDLLERRDHRLAAVGAEALGAGEIYGAELLQAFRLHQLVEDRALALAREADFLVGPLDALLQPRLLRRIGDVHELDAERLAVGAPQDRDHLAERAELEAEHVVEEDAAVEIGVAEAVRARIELFVVARRLKSERVEIGGQGGPRAGGGGQAPGTDRNEGA